MSIHDFTHRIDDLDQRIQSIQQYFVMMRSHPDADDDDRKGFDEMLTWAGMSRDILSDMRASGEEEARNGSAELGMFDESLRTLEQQTGDFEQQVIAYHRMLAEHEATA